MKTEVTALPGFEDVDFSNIEKEGKSMPDISPSNELEYLSEVIIPDAISANYEKYTILFKV